LTGLTGKSKIGNGAVLSLAPANGKLAELATQKKAYKKLVGHVVTVPV